MSRGLGDVYKRQEGFHRTEKDVEKIRALWKDGYDEGMERLDEVQAFLSGS